MSGYDPAELGALLNEAVQRSKTRGEAEELLNGRGVVLVRVVADLNHLTFAAATPRKETLIRAILDDSFGKDI